MGAAGQKQEAVRRLRSCIRCPDWIAWCKDDAAWLLGGCGKPGVEALVSILEKSPRPSDREALAGRWLTGGVLYLVHGAPGAEEANRLMDEVRGYRA